MKFTLERYPGSDIYISESGRHILKFTTAATEEEIRLVLIAPEMALALTRIEVIAAEMNQPGRESYFGTRLYSAANEILSALNAD